MTDNIAQSPPAVADAENSEEFDNYLKKFNATAASLDALKGALDAFRTQPDDQQRLYATMRACQCVYDALNKQYELTVEINNFLGSRQVD